ncbi:MAG: sulfotransferase [Anaerolineales bacterium]|nr:sulfotransferase [Anaerolineales bacterium]
MSSSSMWRRLILVTGSARSGTTWLNAVLGVADEVSYIRYEPLMVRRHPETPYGAQVLSWRSLPVWHRDPAEEIHQNYAAAVRSHVEALVQHYFNGPVDTFIIKDPHPQYLPFLIQTLSPDHVITIRRHPLGVINSYDRENLYQRWDVPVDFQNFTGSIRELFPAAYQIALPISRTSEMLAVMSHFSQLYMKEHLAGIPHSHVNYEDLCLKPEEEVERLFQELGWSWNPAVWDRMKVLIYPRSDQVGEGFQNLKKRSEERAYAWRMELAPMIIHRIQKLFYTAGLEENFPGYGLPVLTMEEKGSGWRTYLSRRWKLIRTFKFRDLPQYLNP